MNKTLLGLILVLASGGLGYIFLSAAHDCDKKPYDLNVCTTKAELGDAKAQYNLGVMYDNGDGVPQDYEQAAKWFRAAAEQGHAAAQNNLGVIYYYYGQGVSQDYKKALKWFRAAAEQGHADAQYHLGEMYTGGRGVSQDYVKAHMFFNLANFHGYVGVASRRKGAALKRDSISKEMSRLQIEEAQDLAREWMSKHEPQNNKEH